MITDKQQIQTAMDCVLSQEMYLPLTREAFEEICPTPTMAINVVARDANEAAFLLKIELSQINGQQLSGIVVFLQSTSMTMRDLEYINTVFPHCGCEHFKRGISFTKPESGEVEIWFFATTCKKTRFSRYK